MRWVEVRNGFAEERELAYDSRDAVKERIRTRLAEMQAGRMMTSKFAEAYRERVTDELTRYDKRPTDEEHERLRMHIKSP